jgi:uncharacterized membrane protein
MRVSDALEGFLEARIYSNRPLMEFLFLALLVYLALDAVILAWFLAAPFAVQSGSRLAFGSAMLAYNFGYLSSNCHQMPERSLIIAGYEMPFCARDTGIYFGCLLGALMPFMPLRRPAFVRSLWFCLLIMLPMAVDGVSQTIFDMRESTNALRLATGFLFGVGMVLYFAEKVVERAKPYVEPRVDWQKTLRITAVFCVLLLAGSWWAGGAYVTRSEAVAESGMNPTFVYYATKRSLSTVRADPYISSYNDAVLAGMLEYGRQGHGAWIIYNGTMEHSGKYVFFSGGDGEFRFVPDVSST